MLRPARNPLHLCNILRSSSVFSCVFLKKKFFFYWFIYLWLCWVFVSVRELSPVAASGGHSSSRCTGLSLLRPLMLRSTGSRRAGSVIVAHGPSFSAACGIFPDQGSNPCPLHWQADSQPLRHQGSPSAVYFITYYFIFIDSYTFWGGQKQELCPHWLGEETEAQKDDGIQDSDG